jgi:hypothetical protein
MADAAAETTSGIGGRIGGIHPRDIAAAATVAVAATAALYRHHVHDAIRQVAFMIRTIAATLLTAAAAAAAARTMTTMREIHTLRPSQSFLRAAILQCQHNLTGQRAWCRRC